MSPARKTALHPTVKRKKGHAQVAASLAGPMFTFCLPSEIKQLTEEEPARRTGRNAKTLVKNNDLRVVLVVMKKGVRMQQHKAAGPISIQTIAGKIKLCLPDQDVELPSGHLLALERYRPHDVEALRDSAFLLSISWPEGASHEEA
jgi:quercetin dioxygenase-like cupin family protein